MGDNNCIFCKIISGDIPSTTLYEDELFKVILDIRPATRGHVLLLPKEHAADIYELPEETAAKAMILAKKLMTEYAQVLGAEGYNLVQNNGVVAGQTVFHFHMHLIPRYKKDKMGGLWKEGKLTEEERAELAEKLGK